MLALIHGNTQKGHQNCTLCIEFGAFRKKKGKSCMKKTVVQYKGKAITKNQEFVVDIEDLTAEGAGVAKHNTID